MQHFHSIILQDLKELNWNAITSTSFVRSPRAGGSRPQLFPGKVLFSPACWEPGFQAWAHKAGGGDGIPVELFQILKDDAVKVLYSICQPGISLEGMMLKLKLQYSGSNDCTIAVISHASKVMLISHQARLQQYTNRELPQGRRDLT